MKNTLLVLGIIIMNSFVNAQNDLGFVFNTNEPHIGLEFRKAINEKDYHRFGIDYRNNSNYWWGGNRTIHHTTDTIVHFRNHFNLNNSFALRYGLEHPIVIVNDVKLTVGAGLGFGYDLYEKQIWSSFQYVGKAEEEQTYDQVSSQFPNEVATLSTSYISPSARLTSAIYFPLGKRFLISGQYVFEMSYKIKVKEEIKNNNYNELFSSAQNIIDSRSRFELGVRYKLIKK